MRGGRATLIADGGVLAEDVDGWCLWQRVVEQIGTWPSGPTDLGPGWVGYVGFEQARYLERLPATHRFDLGLPLMRLALFDRVIVLDHASRRAYEIGAPGLADCLGVRGAGGDLKHRLQTGATAQTGVTSDVVRRVVYEQSRVEHERAVRRALEYIAAGDIYQVNLAQRMHVGAVSDVRGAYATLRQVNPAPYAALLHWPGGAIASVSPELMLSLRGDRVLTRPIKGTRPRTGDAERDAVHRHELEASAKEAAELVMIVDLHRNDLGRVCVPGSVSVPWARRTEAHPAVFHTVADVVGRLAPGRAALDLLRACFPAGSIVGVPKIRALEIIDELEPVARGAYTGAVCALGLDGSLTANVAIRTLQIHEQTATLYVGGGIVADSDPAAEYDETMAKAYGILRGLSVVDGDDRTGDGRVALLSRQE